MILKRFLLFLAVLVVPVLAFTTRAQGSTVYDPAPVDTIHPIQDDSAPALIALAAMYVPMENEASWTRMVCNGMTEGGCAYFKENLASALWESQSGNIGSSSGFIANVKTINEDVQVWKTQVTVFTSGKEKASDVFALVRRDTDGRWYLDRILSGPGISLQ